MINKYFDQNNPPYTAPVSTFDQRISRCFKEAMIVEVEEAMGENTVLQ